MTNLNVQNYQKNVKTFTKINHSPLNLMSCQKNFKFKQTKENDNPTDNIK